MIDDRITVPLSVLRINVFTYCRVACGSRHDDGCLRAVLHERDELLAKDQQRAYTQGLDPDCLIGGAKHLACTGCACNCHRHSLRGAS